MAAPLATCLLPASARLARAPCNKSGAAGSYGAAARKAGSAPIAAQHPSPAVGGPARRGALCAAQPSHLAEKRCSPCEESGGSLEYMGLCEVGSRGQLWAAGAS